MNVSEFKPRIPDIKIVTLDDYYQNIYNPQAREFFTALTLLRAEAYGPEYQKGILPLDVIDFIGRHHLFYVSGKDNILKPIAAYRAVTLKKLSDYNLNFSLLMSVQNAVNTKTHVLALNDLIERSQKQGQDMLYNSNLVILKECRNIPELSALVREYMTALFVEDLTQLNNPIAVSGATIRFKIDKFFYSLGYEPLSWHGESLPPFEKTTMAGEPVLLIKCEKLSSLAQECHQKHRAHIGERLIISSNGEKSTLPQAV